MNKIIVTDNSINYFPLNKLRIIEVPLLSVILGKAVHNLL